MNADDGGMRETFRTRPDRPRDPPSPLYNGYRISFLGMKRRGVTDHPTPSSTEVKEIVKIHIYSHSGPSYLALR